MATEMWITWTVLMDRSERHRIYNSLLRHRQQVSAITVTQAWDVAMATEMWITRTVDGQVRVTQDVQQFTQTQTAGKCHYGNMSVGCCHGNRNVDYMDSVDRQVRATQDVQQFTQTQVSGE